MNTIRTASLVLLSILGACAAPGAGSDLLNTVVWVQTSAERVAVCTQAFRAATQAMLARTAEIDANSRPAAVIVDVDETVLDNSPYQASLVRDGTSFAADTWRTWCEAAQAAAIPGAVDFAATCHQRGVTVFYVTNREVEVERATRRNLAQAGFPLDDRDGVRVVLCHEPGKPASKEARRQRIAAEFDVVAIVGDDLNDFVDAEASVVQRRLQAQRHADEWGSRWFVVPNPMYGSWERAVVLGDDPATGKRAALAPAR